MEGSALSVFGISSLQTLKHLTSESKKTSRTQYRSAGSRTKWICVFLALIICVVALLPFSIRKPSATQPEYFDSKTHGCSEAPK